MNAKKAHSSTNLIGRKKFQEARRSKKKVNEDSIVEV